MSKGNILLIDDEMEIIESLKFLIEDLADNVYLANSSLEGADMAIKEKIHCIICDFKMPDLTGLELLKQIRDKGYGGPFIFYSGQFSESVIEEASSYDVYAFLHKPQFDGIESIVTAALAESVG